MYGIRLHISSLLSNQHSLSLYYVPGTVLGAGVSTERKTDTGTRTRAAGLKGLPKDSARIRLLKSTTFPEQPSWGRQQLSSKCRSPLASSVHPCVGTAFLHTWYCLAAVFNPSSLSRFCSCAIWLAKAAQLNNTQLFSYPKLARAVKKIEKKKCIRLFFF